MTNERRWNIVHVIGKPMNEKSIHLEEAQRAAGGGKAAFGRLVNGLARAN